MVKLRFGVEVEFLALVCTPDEDARFYKFHQDYGVAYELNTPVMSLDEPETLVHAFTVEAVAWKHGLRLHYASVHLMDGSICGVYEDRRPMSAHLHFSVSPMSLMPLLHNWLVFLTPVLSPLMVLPYSAEITNDDNDIVISIRRDKWLRMRITHFAKAPAYVSKGIVEEAYNTTRRFRGYTEAHNNAYFAVELNKYRKSAVTIEDRVNEQHAGIAIILAEILKALLEKRLKPPIAHTGCLYYKMYDAKLHNIGECILLDRGLGFDNCLGIDCMVARLLEAIDSRISDETRELLEKLAEDNIDQSRLYRLLNRKAAALAERMGANPRELADVAEYVEAESRMWHKTLSKIPLPPTGNATPL